MANTIIAGEVALQQRVARALADVLLAQAPALSDSINQARADARASVERWVAARGAAPGAWKIRRETIATRLLTLIDAPWQLNQQGLDCCAYAAILYACLRNFPLETAKYAMELFDDGQGTLGGVELRGNSPLRNVAEAALTALPKWPHPADWMMLTAMRSSQAPSDETFDGMPPVSGKMLLDLASQSKLAGKMKSLFVGASGWGRSGDIDLGSVQVEGNTALFDNNFHTIVLLFLHSGIFPESAFFDMGIIGHSVLLDSSLVKGTDVDGETTVSFFVYSYGKRQQIVCTYKKFKRSMVGLIVAIARRDKRK